MLYGPSLLGRKILLPLDVLGEEGYYLPAGSTAAPVPVHDVAQADLVLHVEPGRRWVGSEIRAGRFPLWNPYEFCGAPNTWPKLSPFFLLGALVESPKVLAWLQLLTAIVAGLGFYAYCRRALRLSLWPSAVASWCYPITGFFVLWQGYTLIYAVAWLPWQLLAVHKACGRRPGPWAAGLAITTCLVLISGQADVGAQVLMVSGVYAAGRLLQLHRGRLLTRASATGAARVGAGAALGLLLAAPVLLPSLEYARTGARVRVRATGEEARPPLGLGGLPQVVLPDSRGSSERGSLPIGPSPQPTHMEGPAAAYTGILATLLLAPLAVCSRRHRGIVLLLAFLVVVGLSWILDLPGFVQLLRLPGLNLMSHNRLVFAASFSILAMAAIGLEALRRGDAAGRGWFWLPAALLAAIGGWCFYRAVVLPEPIATEYPRLIAQGGTRINWVGTLDDMRIVQSSYVRAFLKSGVLGFLGAAGWLLVRARRTWPGWAVPVLGLAMAGDLLWFHHGRRVQSDPALYYPRIPVLDRIAASGSGRVVGYDCLPAALAQIEPLRDVRGYDGVDPARLIALLKPVADPRATVSEYAQTQWFAPRMDLLDSGAVRLPPVLDMLGVRTVILRGSPPPGVGPAFAGADYWALVNPNAMPRAFVPRRVATIADERLRVDTLTSPGFDPRDVAYIETPAELPAACRGRADIVRDLPDHVTLSVSMETPGLVVLSDLWDAGWRATLGGRRVQILRANEAVRGVVVPPGASTLEFRYRPASLVLGLWLAAGAAAVLLGWAILAARRS